MAVRRWATFTRATATRWSASHEFSSSMWLARIFLAHWPYRLLINASIRISEMPLVAETTCLKSFPSQTQFQFFFVRRPSPQLGNVVDDTATSIPSSTRRENYANKSPLPEPDIANHTTIILFIQIQHSPSCDHVADFADDFLVFSLPESIAMLSTESCSSTSWPDTDHAQHVRKLGTDWNFMISVTPRRPSSLRRFADCGDDLLDFDQ